MTDNARCNQGMREADRRFGPQNRPHADNSSIDAVANPCVGAAGRAEAVRRFGLGPNGRGGA